MQKQIFGSFDVAEEYLTKHAGTCEFKEVRLPCNCLVAFPCKSCGAQLVKTGAQTIARGGAYCSTCGAVLRADKDRGHKARRTKVVEGASNG